MGKIKSLDKEPLLAALEVDIQAVGGGEELTMEQMGLARSLLKLADINQEQEYQLCRSVAEWLLERVPEPEDIDVE